jgi:hypothetical protein
MQHINRYLVLIEQDEDGVYVASVPALRGCHTQAKSARHDGGGCKCVAFPLTNTSLVSPQR